jgi:hypothetical protein
MNLPVPFSFAFTSGNGFPCSIIYLANYLAKIIVFDIRISFIARNGAWGFSKAETPHCFIENENYNGDK